MTAAPACSRLQRALVWLVGACKRHRLIEPSPYELATLGASLIFFCNRLADACVFVRAADAIPAQRRYTIGRPSPFLDKSEVANWIATSWYMAVTVIFFAMVISD